MKDLIQKLICDSQSRLGKLDAAEIKKHPFFYGVNWAQLRSQKAPFIPTVLALF